MNKLRPSVGTAINASQTGQFAEPLFPEPLFAEPLVAEPLSNADRAAPATTPMARLTPAMMRARDGWSRIDSSTVGGLTTVMPDSARWRSAAEMALVEARRSVGAVMIQTMATNSAASVPAVAPRTSDARIGQGASTVSAAFMPASRCPIS